MDLLSKDGKHKAPADVHLNIVPLVDMMMVLVIFLVMNFNATGEMLFLSTDMKMPLAEHGLGVTRVPIIAVSYSDPNRCDADNAAADCTPGDGSQNLYFEGQIIADLNAIDLDEANLLIPELEEKLTDNRERFEQIGGNRADDLPPEEDPTTTANVQIDQHVKFEIIKRVLSTCEQAGYGRIRLAVGDGRKSGLGGEPVEEAAE